MEVDLDGARIVIVMMSAIGDVVHVLPVLHALKRHAPTCHITWVLKPVPANLVRGHPLIDEIVEFNPDHGWRAYIEVASRLRQERFDLLLDFQVALKAGIVTALLRARTKLGFDRARARDANWLFTNTRIPPHAPQHVADQYFEFLRYLNVEPEPVAWHLGPWKSERAWQQEFFSKFDRPVASINIATTNADRDWVPERWAGVIDALWDQYGLESVLVGGRSDRELATAAAISSTARHKPQSALGSGVRRLVSILDGSALIIALDSAPLHIGTALGRPVISLMANADPRRTGPYRRSQDLIVDRYHDAGEVSPISSKRRWGRMPLITVDDVLARLEIWHNQYAAIDRAVPDSYV
jgi:heptosyltransferase I